MKSEKTFVWDQSQTADEINSMLTVLSEAYDIKSSGEGVKLQFKPSEQADIVTVDFDGDAAVIEYGQPHLAARGLSALLSGLVIPGQKYQESTPFEKFGIMMDCSRNAVMTVSHIKKWLKALALFGYNLVMLYTEETYELPDEPYFGYMRGRYTAEELKEIDDYAAELNIEVIGCIQTLGHLARLLRWPAYSKIKDTSSVMMVDEPATYELIEKMVSHFASVFRSKRIHVGMDETHDLGRGAFMDKNGYERGYDIFNRHLAKVVEICKKHELKPMIWSDMYFRLGSPTQQYYYKDAQIPDDVKAAIPEEVELVYWDYYHNDEEFYVDYINKHYEMNRNTLLGSGVMTWLLLWYGHRQTVKKAIPSINASRQTGLKEIFFTMWGDNGAYCELDSAMAGLAMCADHAYIDQCDEKKTALRFENVFGGNYQAIIEASKMNDQFAEGLDPIDEGFAVIDTLFWENPITAPEFKKRTKESPDIWQSAVVGYKQILDNIEEFKDQTAPVDMNHAWNLVNYLSIRFSWRSELDEAYAQKDINKLASLRDQVDNIIKAINNLLVSFRRQWQNRNKPFGLEILQERFGGQKECYRELKLRITELLEGKIDSIPEIEEV